MTLEVISIFTPFSAEFQEFWISTAKTNTEIFEEVGIYHGHLDISGFHSTLFLIFFQCIDFLQGFSKIYVRFTESIMQHTLPML